MMRPYGKPRHMTLKEYLKYYELPQHCPNCKSASVRFRFGIYYCNNCGYKNEWALLDPSKLELAQAMSLGSFSKILGSHEGSIDMTQKAIQRRTHYEEE